MNRKTSVLVALILAIIMLFVAGCQPATKDEEKPSNSENSEVSDGKTDDSDDDGSEGDNLEEDSALLPDGEVITYWTAFTGAPMAKSPGETEYYKMIQKKQGYQ